MGAGDFLAVGPRAENWVLSENCTANQGSSGFDAAAWSQGTPAYLAGHPQGLLVASGITPSPSVFLAAWKIWPFLGIERPFSTKSAAWTFQTQN